MHPEEREERTDRELAAAVIIGDERAAVEFVRRYERLVTHIVFRMVFNETDREDLCQDIFLRVLKNLKRFRYESKLSTWIGQIAYNHCINFLKKKKAILFDDNTKAGTIENIAGESRTPDELVETSDLSESVQQEIAKLKMPYRTILTLYHVDEMSYAEIAEIMSMPEGTVKSYLFRARKMLSKALHTQYRRERLCSTAI
jgi:RNA polymerase sigma-70 factor (ECF subfamily)